MALNYVEGGANAISILTDELFFGGNIEDLKIVSSALTHPLESSPTAQQAKQIPLLRKDFIIDEIQIAQAINAGADAILLIVAVLGTRTQKLLDCAKKMGIDVLVEIHDETELKIALESGAEIVGINNRNLSSLEVDTNRALKLAHDIPPHIIRVAESGILEPKIAQTYHQAGFDAVLIGEALVKSKNPAEFMGACRA